VSIRSRPNQLSPYARRQGGTTHADRPATADDILAGAQASRDVIQEFVPLAESSEWRLGQEYLRQRGNKAFLSDAHPVPFVINNDGALSQHAAEVLFAALAEAEREAPLPADLFVLELGIGVGLFARFFLDAFRELCDRNRKDYYHRLTYLAADRSQRMLRDVARHGVLAGHAGRYRLRLVDALDPAPLLRDLTFLGQPARPLRGVFLNYLLDCLPAAVLEFDGDRSRQLCVRTCVARNLRLEDYTDLTAQQLAERAKKGGAEAERDLLEVYGLFASEYDYRPVELGKLPYGEFAAEYGRRTTGRILHSWGAIQCLERLLEMVDERGFILASDYGQTQASREDELEHQRFSLATFVGVNFPLLKHYFGEAGRCEYLEPTGDQDRGIHSRLLGRRLPPKAALRFEECFGQAAQKRLQEGWQKARECARVGRFELAATYYRAALKVQSYNWILLNELAMFLIFSLREIKAGVDLAKLALALNPTCSAELWNTLGDGLFEWGRTAEARSAYQKALAVNESDVRARYNLAWVYQRERDYPAALAVIAEALALDRTGEYRERLLQKQTEVLAGQEGRNRQEYLLMINLVSKYANPQDRATPERGLPAVAGTPGPAAERAE
jgi:tetratricopeptide (TPR) repeat protein